MEWGLLVLASRTKNTLKQNLSCQGEKKILGLGTFESMDLKVPELNMKLQWVLLA